MSVEASAWAWRQPMSSSGALLVLLALADHADRTGFCWPGAEGLAAKCQLSRSTIWRHIADFEAANIVTRTRRSSSGGRRSNSYQLHLDNSNDANQDVADTVLRGRNVAKDDHQRPTGAISNDANRGVALKEIESSIEPSSELSNGEAMPDYYTDIEALPGFTKGLAEVEAWMASNNVTRPMAQRAAAALRGKWPGPKRSPYKDPWATFRNWALRERDTGTGTGRSTRIEPNKTTKDLMQSWGGQDAITR